MDIFFSKISNNQITLKVTKSCKSILLYKSYKINIYIKLNRIIFQY
jgi:hypothetical protein